jgi:hypothetical protein
VSAKPKTIWLNVFNLGVSVESADPELLSLLIGNYGHMRRDFEQPSLSYVVGRSDDSPTLFLSRIKGETLTASDEGEFLFLFEKDMTIELQKLRSDLYFVHAAALEFEGKATMLVAASGGAKSVTTWALLHHGFGYLSDELAPVDLRTLDVHPYPHALCLKDEPPASYPLPEETFQTVRTLHVPVEALPGRALGSPTPLAAILFLCYRPDSAETGIQPIGKAEAAARLFANALNPLAHQDDGLEAAIKIVKGSKCFELFPADLPSACELVKTTLKDPSPARSKRPFAETPNQN